MYRCSDGLCFSDVNGNLFVNPTSRLALMADCLIGDGSNCKEPMTYKWEIKDQQLDLDTIAPPYFLTTDTEIEFAIEAEYIDSLLPARSGFTVALAAENGDEVKGINMIFMR